MRKFICCTMLLASAFSFIGCQEELTNNVPDGKPLTSFTAIAEDINTDTKTTMSYKYDILWNEGDLITITDEDGSWDEFILVAGEGTAKGTFRQNNATECEVWENDVVRAYYPANIAEVDHSVETILTWPSKQTASQTMLMYSEISLGDRQNEQINFKNLGAMMQVVVNSVTPDVVLKSIKIQDGTKPLSGTFTIDNNDNAVITTSGNAGITLDLGTGTSLGKSAKFFNICVPPGTYSDLTFTFTAMDGATFVKDVPSLTFDRNTVYKITLSSEFTHEAVQLWEDGPFWATTNIGGGAPEDYGWYFSWGNTVGYVYDRSNWKNALTGAAFSGGFTEANYSSTPGVSAASPLDAAHDPAAVFWGGDWRMPTTAECTLIRSKTTVSSEPDYNGTGVKGWIISGKGDYAGNSIFIPFSGVGQESLQNVGSIAVLNVSESNTALVLQTGGASCRPCNNYYGLPVRAVYSAPIPVEGISISPESLQIREGYDAKVTALLLPEKASGSVVWTSTDTDVVTVDQEGNISGISAGHAAVVAACDEKMAFCNVEVIPWVKVTSVSLNQTSVTASLGQELTLTPTILPANASDKTVIWSSDNTSVATVDQNGKVTCRDYGQVRITAASNEYPDITAYCDINVTIVPVSSVSLNKTELTLEVDGSETLIATITPYNADNQSVTWRTSNRSAVIVDDGKVYAVGKGSATITVTTDDGAHTASCTVYSRFTEVGVQLWEGGPFWATHNFGGGKPEDYGKHVCWGDDKGFIYNNSSWWLPGALTNNTYSFTEANYNTNTCTSPVQNFGYIKNISRDLSGADGTDIVAYEWTQKIDSTIPWHIPSVQDFENLLANTRYEWFSDYEGTGVAGCLFTGKGNYSDKSIFIPAAGLAVGSNWENYEFVAYHSTCIGYYMTRDYQTDFPDQVKFFMLDERAIFSQYNTSTAFGLNPRYEGFSIRPVHYPGE